LIEILFFIEFTSARKRSTVVIKDNDSVKIFTKGADNIIIGLLSKD
jgi:magnesium-transporting ATPase (P-type)